MWPNQLLWRENAFYENVLSVVINLAVFTRTWVQSLQSREKGQHSSYFWWIHYTTLVGSRSASSGQRFHSMRLCCTTSELPQSSFRKTGQQLSSPFLIVSTGIIVSMLICISWYVSLSLCLCVSVSISFVFLFTCSNSVLISLFPCFNRYDCFFVYLLWMIWLLALCRSPWAFTAWHWGKRGQEESGTFNVTTSSIMMEFMSVTKAMI